MLGQKSIAGGMLGGMSPGETLALMQSAVEHHRGGRVDEAERIYRRVLDDQPLQPDALHLLGLILHGRGQFADAAMYVERAVAAQPCAVYHVSLARIRRETGDRAGAIGCCRRAMALHPDDLDALLALSADLLADNCPEEALAIADHARRVYPESAAAHYNAGSALLALNRPREAETALRAAVSLAPDSAPSYHNLALALSSRGDLAGAGEALARAFAITPDFRTAGNLGNLLLSELRVSDAIAWLRRAVELAPDSPEVHSNLLFALSHDPAISPDALLAEHRSWDERHARPLAPLGRSFDNDRSPERRLRIGYVSADFRSHPVGLLIAPILAHHDRERFTVCCYSNTRRADAMTARLRGLAQEWRNVATLDDETLARRIREDAVDILIDLSGHTAGNRLCVFAHKPAPVQATWLGYPGSTGLSSIDYLLTSRHFDPRGDAQRYCTERLIYIPCSFICYSAPENAPEVAARTGPLTFGCLNAPAKVSDAVLDCWFRILSEIPEARLLLHAEEGPQRQSVRGQAVSAGVSPERIAFVPRQPAGEYYATFNRIDIALDPFPYNGGMTTCDALWMGTPVVTRASDLPGSRVGLYLLSVLGLRELVADSGEDYIRIAVELARDRARRERLHQTLRQRMRESDLMNAAQVTRDVEDAFRGMWRSYCAQ